jgi:hypothetical protein
MEVIAVLVTASMHRCSGPGSWLLVLSLNRQPSLLFSDTATHLCLECTQVDKGNRWEEQRHKQGYNSGRQGTTG